MIDTTGGAAAAEESKGPGRSAGQGMGAQAASQ